MGDKEQIAGDLAYAGRILRERGFFLASQWAIEQWMGMADTSSPAKSLYHLEELEDSAVVSHAQTCFAVGDFGLAASTLTECHKPKEGLSTAAKQLRIYAWYLTGEAQRARRIEE